MSVAIEAPSRVRGAAAPPWALREPPAGGPFWLRERRRQALSWVKEHGLPTTKDEDWRYSALNGLLGRAFAPSGQGVGLPEGTQPYGPRLGGPRLVFVNGRLAPGLSQPAALPSGTRLQSLRTALTDRDRELRRFWGPPAGGYPHAFWALNDALANDGVFLKVPAGVVVEAPIELVFVASSAGPPVMANPRSLVVAGAGSRATVIEVYAGSSHSPTLTNAVTQLVLGDGAHIDHYRFQTEDDTAFHLSGVRAHLGRDSSLSSRLLATGAALGRHEIVARLDGEHAALQLDGLCLPGRAQHHDNPVLVDHSAPNCASEQLFKSIVDDQSSFVFNGHVVVRPGATGTEARQVNKNLLLSVQAAAYTRPRLEIFSDDVACTHGAAVGHLDEHAMFYLRSRGIPEATARRMLVGAFSEDLLARWPADLQEFARRLVVTRLETDDPSPPGQEQR